MRLEIGNISKQFGLDHALRGVSLGLRAGEQHALLGPHGAGKSTLAALLAGEMRPDAGVLRLDGHRYAPRHSRDARAAGVVVISGQPELLPDLTVEETLLLGFEPGRLGVVRAKARHEAARRALASLRSRDIPLSLPVGHLPLNQQRRVALARALIGHPRVIVLDEPAPMPDYDHASLLLRLRELAAAGSSVLLLTGSPERARELGGAISLLHEGHLEPPLSTLPVRLPWDDGQALPRRRLRPRLGPVMLALHHAMNADWQAPLNLSIREGEVIGLAGEAGAGRRALLRMIAGLAPVETGAVHLGGRSLPRRPASLRSGIHFIDLGDEATALFPDRPVYENLFLTRLGRRLTADQGRPLGRFGFFPPEEARMGALDWMEKLRIRPGLPSQPAGELPLANRRKLLLGRLLQSRGRLYLIYDPPGPLEAELRESLYGWLSEMAAEGRSVVIAGPGPGALLGFADRIVALRRGEITDQREAAAWSLHELEAALSRHSPLPVP